MSLFKNKKAQSEWILSRIDLWSHRLYLGEWRIKFSVQSMKYLGQNFMEPEYFRAYIDLDVQRHDSLKHLDETIRHEMIHILHGPFNEAFQLVKAVTDGKLFDTFQQAYNQACEKFVHNTEDLFDEFDWND